LEGVVRIYVYQLLLKASSLRSLWAIGWQKAERC